RVLDPVLPPHRARAAAGAGHRRSQPLRLAGAREPRAAVGTARRTAPVLQHHRVRPDGRRDVLPHVPGAGRDGTQSLHVRVGPARTLAGVTRRYPGRERVALSCRRAAMLALAVLVGAVACDRPGAAPDVVVRWALTPEPPGVGPAQLDVVLRTGEEAPVEAT